MNLTTLKMSVKKRRNAPDVGESRATLNVKKKIINVLTVREITAVIIKDAKFSKKKLNKELL